MKTGTKLSLRELLKKDGVIVAPGCIDVPSAKIVEGLGFPAVYLGGWATGAKLGVTEPLTTMTEMVREASYITRRCDIPLIVDADAGFGDATHTRRTVLEFIRAGVSAIHIEDQMFPKRVGYHVGLKYVIPIEEMLVKIRTALDARGDSDMLIIARTDSREAENGSLEDAVERCRKFAELGADVIMPYSCRPPSYEEACYVGKSIKAPLLYVNDESDHPNLTVDQIASAGFKIIIYPLTASLAAAQATKSAYTHLKEKGVTYLSPEAEQMVQVRKVVEDSAGIPELYAIEKKDGRAL